MKSFKIKNRVLFWSLFSAFTLFVICYLYFSLDGIWMFFNVPFMNPIFADLINVTHAHLALEAGLDPIFSNPFDPWCRPMPYPRIWLYLRHFFFTCENTVYIAFLQMFFFLCSVYSLLRDVNVKYSWVCLIFIFSPSVLFCVERGNVDLTIFSLLMLCLININKSRVWSSLFLLFSSLLKIYPIFAILVLFKSGLKISIKSTWPILFIFIVYFSLVFDDLIQINKIVNFSQDVGFGLKPLVYFLTNLKFKWTMIFLVLNIFILFLFYRFVFRLNYRIFDVIVASRLFCLNHFHY